MINAQDTEVFFHVFRYLFFFLPYSLSYFFTLHGEQWCGLMIDQSDLLGVPSNKLPQKKKKKAYPLWRGFIWTQFSTGPGKTLFNTRTYRLLVHQQWASLSVTNHSHANAMTCSTAHSTRHTILPLCTFQREWVTVLYWLLLTCFSPKTFVRHDAWDDFAHILLICPHYADQMFLPRSFS